MITKIASSDTVLTYSVSSPLADVLAEFADLRGSMGKVEFYQIIADKLGKLVGETWTWRYIQGVERGTIQPSSKLSEAIRRMGEALDGRHPDLTGLIPVSVLGREDVRPGSVILGSSKICANPSCGVMFVPRVPWGKYCSKECR